MLGGWGEPGFLRQKHELIEPIEGGAEHLRRCLTEQNSDVKKGCLFVSAAYLSG